MLANQIKQYVKRLHIMIKWGLSRDMKVWFNIKINKHNSSNQCSNEEKPYDHLGAEIVIWQNLTSIHEISSQQTMNWNFLNPVKCIEKESTANIILKDKRLGMFPIRSGTG